MRKIDYKAIKWDAQTYGEFCGTAANLDEMYKRVGDYLGNVGMRLVDFVYRRAEPVFAYEKGDVVTTAGASKRFATVTGRISKNGIEKFMEIQFSDGSVTTVRSDMVARSLAPADIPEELIALARAEAGKDPDFSKCPLKNPACMEA